MLTFKPTSVNNLYVGTKFLRHNLNGTADVLTILAARVGASTPSKLYVKVDDPNLELEMVLDRADIVFAVSP